jgi:hypothetical protein
VEHQLPMMGPSCGRSQPRVYAEQPCLG